MIAGYIDNRGYLFCMFCVKPARKEAQDQLADLPKSIRDEQVESLFGPVHHDSPPHNGEKCDVCSLPILDRSPPVNG